MRLAIFVPMLAVFAAGCASDTSSAAVSTTRSVKSTSSVSVSTQAAPTSASDTTPTTQVRRPLDPNPIRATITNGCPPSVGGHPDYGSTAAEWIDNPDRTGLADSFVPGQPTEALICRYAALDAVNGPRGRDEAQERRSVHIDLARRQQGQRPRRDDQRDRPMGLLVSVCSSRRQGPLHSDRVRNPRPRRHRRLVEGLVRLPNSRQRSPRFR